MSIYDNETKIYPDLNPTAPQEPQTQRLNKLSKIEAKQFWQKNETIQYNHRYHRHRPSYIDGDHWRNFYRSICQSRWIACWYCFGWNQLLVSLATVITRKFFKIFTAKQEKRDGIKLFAQSKLDSIANIISQGMQDGDISPTEFHKVLQEVEKYRKLKADIRNQAKAKVKDYKITARRNT